MNDLEANNRRGISDIQPQLLKKTLECALSESASRGAHIPGIIFKH